MKPSGAVKWILDDGVAAYCTVVAAPYQSNFRLSYQSKTQRPNSRTGLKYGLGLCQIHFAVTVSAFKGFSVGTFLSFMHDFQGGCGFLDTLQELTA